MLLPGDKAAVRINQSESCQHPMTLYQYYTIVVSIKLFPTARVNRDSTSGTAAVFECREIHFVHIGKRIPRDILSEAPLECGKPDYLYVVETI
jgi:hypothetical protein